jgi:hypothetical protein
MSCVWVVGRATAGTRCVCVALYIVYLWRARTKHMPRLMLRLVPHATGATTLYSLSRLSIKKVFQKARRSAARGLARRAGLLFRLLLIITKCLLEAACLHTAQPRPRPRRKSRMVARPPRAAPQPLRHKQSLQQHSSLSFSFVSDELRLRNIMTQRGSSCLALRLFHANANMPMLKTISRQRC